MRFCLFIIIFFHSSTCLADVLIALDQAAIESVSGTYDSPYFGRRLTNDAETSQDEAATFTPPIARLLVMAGYTLTSDHSKEVFSYTSKLDENYDSFSWWRMQEEFKKPLPKRETRTNETIFEMSTRLAKTPVTDTARRREFLMTHSVNR